MKIPKTIYIKEKESEQIKDIGEKINKEREIANKRPLKGAELIHHLIEKGIILYEQRQ